MSFHKIIILIQLCAEFHFGESMEEMNGVGLVSCAVLRHDDALSKEKSGGWLAGIGHCLVGCLNN